MTRRRAWMTIGVAVWAVVSVGYAVESWPERSAPRERDEISCRIDGKTVTARVFKDPYARAIEEMSRERGAREDEMSRAQGVRADALCALHARTQLPLGIVYTYFSELREAMQRSDFSAGAFLEDALKKDAAEEAAAQLESAARRQEEQVTAVISGAAMFALPLAGLFFTWSALAWTQRRLPTLTRAQIAVGAVLFGSFGCFWLAAAEGELEIIRAEHPLVRHKSSVA